jgi:hypothetical protein
LVFYRKLLLLFFFLYFNYFATFIKTAIWANSVWQDHRSAIGAGYQVGGFQRVMCAPAITAAFRKFTFRLWGHSLLLYMIPVKRADYIGDAYERQA